MEHAKVYPMMPGHNCIGVATALLETGMIPLAPLQPGQESALTRFTLEAPAGDIHIEARSNKRGKVFDVLIRNTPSFVAPGGLEVAVDVPHGVGKVNVDLAFGGMWYCIVDAAQLDLELVPSNGKEICRLGEMIKVACQEQHPVKHPSFDYLGPDIMVFRGPPDPESQAHAKNAVVMSNGKLSWEKPSTWTGMIDRSPCGTGTCAVMATLWAKGKLKIGEPFVHASILGTTFTGRLVEETGVIWAKGESIPAVVATISGQAWITQHCRVVMDPSDPFPEGFTLGDIWAS